MIITENIINILKECIKSDNSFNSSKFNKIKTTDIDDILEKYNLTPNDLWKMWKYGLSEIPKCPVCGKRLKNFSNKYCSISCLNKSDEHKKKIEDTYMKKYGVRCNLMSSQVKEKIKQTNLDKYGVAYVAQAEEIKEKIKETNLKKYGVDCVLQNKEIKEKIKQTNLEKYGVEYYSQCDNYNEKIKKTCQEKYGTINVFQAEEIKNKIRQTNLEKYGVENPHQNKEIIEKAEQTNIEKYGCENVFQSAEIKNKIKTTNLEKYGTEYFSQTDECKEKCKFTCQERYGVEYVSQNEEIKNKIRQTNLEKYGVENPRQNQNIKIKSTKTHRRNYFNTFEKKLLKKKIELVTNFEDYVNLKPIICKCQVCNTIFEAQKSNVQNIYCPRCRISGISHIEKTILDIVKSIYSGYVIENSRNIIKPYELDIYIPEKKIAIEYNGTYWHSVLLNNDMFYHQRKSLMCRDLGIRLVHIYENDNFDDIYDILKSIIIDNKEKTYYYDNIEFVDLNKGYTTKTLKTIFFPTLIKTSKYSYYDAGYAEVVNG